MNHQARWRATLAALCGAALSLPLLMPPVGGTTTQVAAPPLPAGLLAALRPAQPTPPLPAARLRALGLIGTTADRLPPLPATRLRSLSPAVPAGDLLPPLPATRLRGLGPAGPVGTIAERLPPLPVTRLRGLGPAGPVGTTAARLPPLPAGRLQALAVAPVGTPLPPLPATVLQALAPLAPLQFRLALPHDLTTRLPDPGQTPPPVLEPLAADGQVSGACQASWAPAPHQIDANCDRAPRYRLRVFDRIRSQPFAPPSADPALNLTADDLTLDLSVKVPPAWFDLRGLATQPDPTFRLALPLSRLLSAPPGQPVSIETEARTAFRHLGTVAEAFPCNLGLAADVENLAGLLSGNEPALASEPCVRVRLTHPAAWAREHDGTSVPALVPGTDRAAGCTQDAARAAFTCVFDRSGQPPALDVDWGAGFERESVTLAAPSKPAWQTDQPLPKPRPRLADVIAADGAVVASASMGGATSIEFVAETVRLCRGAGDADCCPSSPASLTKTTDVSAFGCAETRPLPDHLQVTLGVTPPTGSGRWRSRVEVSVPLAQATELFAVARDLAFIGYPVAVKINNPAADGREVRLYASRDACERDDLSFQGATLVFDSRAPEGWHRLRGYALPPEGVIAFADQGGLISNCSNVGTLRRQPDEQVLGFDQPPLLVDDSPRTLIVLTSSEDFGAANMRNVGRALADLLQPRLTADAASPLLLLRLEPDGRLSIVADLANRRRLDPAAVRDRLARVGDLAGRGQEPLRDLQTLDTWLLTQDIKVRAILAIAPARAGSLDRRLLGPPLAWRNEGLRLSVLTGIDEPRRLGGADPCTPWRAQAGVAPEDCLYLGTADAGALARFLKDRLP